MQRKRRGNMPTLTGSTLPSDLILASLSGKGEGLAAAPGILLFGSVSSGSGVILGLQVTNIGLPRIIKIGTSITVREWGAKSHSFSVPSDYLNTCSERVAAGQTGTLAVEFFLVSLAYMRTSSPSLEVPALDLLGHCLLGSPPPSDRFAAGI